MFDCFEKRPVVQANKRQCEPRRLFATRKALWCARRRNPLAPLIRRLPEGGAGGRAESHPAFLPEYLYPVGFFANYGPKGTGGNVGKRVPSGHNRRRRLATRSSGKQQAERTAVRAAPIVCPEESPLLATIGDNFAVSKSPLVGIDAPTPARIGTCRPKGRSHFSFGGERKVCKRKPAARRLREKALYCPFWRRGSLCRAQHSWTANIDVRARSELAFFRRQNGRAFFPPLPIAALLPRSRRWAYAPLAGWDVSMWPEGFAAWINGLIFFSPQLAWGRLTPCGLGCFLVAWVFLQRKRPAGFQIHAGLCSEP